MSVETAKWIGVGRIKWGTAYRAPLLLSALAHVLALWHYASPAPDSVLPVGNWVERVSDISPRTKARKRTLSPTPSAVSEPSAAEKAAEEQKLSQALGNTQASTGLSGQIGDLNGVQVTARERYLYELEAFINQHKTYPARARLMGLAGKVEVAFHLHADGSISDTQVARPCPHDILNRAAVDLVTSVSLYRLFPAELKTPVLHVTVPIEYDLH